MNNFRASSLWLAAALIATSSSVIVPRLHAQTPVITPNAVTTSSAVTTSLEGQLVVNRVLADSVEATLTIPRAWLPNTTKGRIALYESGRPAIVAEAKRTFEVVGNTLRTNLRLEIAPGQYEFRLVNDDKKRTTISPAVAFQINGLRREPGVWLFNGSQFVNTSDINNDASAPLFVAGLKRDLGAKPKVVSRNIYTTRPLSWRVLELPLNGNISADDYDFSALQARITQQVTEAHAGGERNFFGFAIKVLNINSATPSTEATKTALRNSIKRIRQIISSLAPEAALILEVDGRLPLFDTQAVNVVAPLCDAVVLNSNDTENWVLKILRRIAEEQPNYDLPIFVKPTVNRETVDSDVQTKLASQNRDALMSGATGFIEYSNDEVKRIVRRNSSLLVGAVTIEDIGVLPAIASSDSMESARLYDELRVIGRIPLLARLPKSDDKKTAPESFLFRVGERIDTQTLADINANVERGVRIYIEGMPKLDTFSPTDLTSWNRLVGGTAKTITQKKTIATMSDPWTFGTASNTRFNLEQSVTVTPNPATLAARTKVEKGVDVLAAPRVLATSEDGSPALILNAVGKGQVLWMPHRVLDIQNTASRAWYEAIAAQVQPGLVTLRDSNDTPLTLPIRVALRRSPRGTLLLGIFNSTAKSVTLRAGIEGVAALALDLATEQELTITKQGNQSFVPVIVAANGWKLIAFGADRKSFDAERNAPLFAAKIK